MFYVYRTTSEFHNLFDLFPLSIYIYIFKSTQQLKSVFQL